MMNNRMGSVTFAHPEAAHRPEDVTDKSVTSVANTNREDLSYLDYRVVYYLFAYQPFIHALITIIIA
jgi:hypothetical protein